MILDRQAFLSAAGSLPYTDVPTPELMENSAVRISVMNGTERDRWDLLLSERKGNYEGLRALLVAMCAVTEAGEKVFGESDVAEVSKTNGIVIDRLYQAAWEINQLGAKHVEGLAKN